MPQKIQMLIHKGNQNPFYRQQQLNTATLGANPSIASPKAPTALQAPMLARVHNVRPGCGSCGRH